MNIQTNHKKKFSNNFDKISLVFQSVFESEARSLLPTVQLDPPNVQSTKSSVRKAISESKYFLECHVYYLRIPSQNFF